MLVRFNYTFFLLRFFRAYQKCLSVEIFGTRFEKEKRRRRRKKNANNNFTKKIDTKFKLNINTLLKYFLVLFSFCFSLFFVFLIKKYIICLRTPLRTRLPRRSSVDIYISIFKIEWVHVLATENWNKHAH